MRIEKLSPPIGAILIDHRRPLNAGALERILYRRQVRGVRILASKSAIISVGTIEALARLGPRHVEQCGGQRGIGRRSFAQPYTGRSVAFIIHKLDACPFKHAPNLCEIAWLGHTDASLIIRNQRCRKDGNFGELSLG
jgi:hypothetical protein